MPTTSAAKTQFSRASDSAPTFTLGHWGQHLTVLAPILMVYCALAFFRIDHQSLWLDEVLGLGDFDPQQPLLVHERWFGGRGPLYPALLQLWSQGGTSEFAVRSLSAVLGSITVCLGYVLGVRLCQRRVALFAALLLATSPFLVWYSQEARYVALMITTAMLATYTFDLTLRAKWTGWWLLYCCSLLIATAAFVVNVFLPLAHGLYLVLTRTHRPVLWKWSLCTLAVLTLFIWWANDGQVRQLGGHLQRSLAEITANTERPPSVQPFDRVSSGVRRDFTLMALPYTFFAFSTGFSLGPSLRELHDSPPLATLRPYALIVLCSALLFGSLFLLGFAALRRHPETGKFLALWLALPLLGALAVSVVIPKMPYNVRYVAMGFPAYILILSAGIASVRASTLQMLLLAAVLVVHGVSLANYYVNPRFSREDARGVARYLEASARAGDAIVVIGTAEPLQYYYKGGVPIIDAGGMFRARPPGSDPLQELSADHNRVWLVSIRAWQADPQGMIKAAFDARHTPVEHKEFPGVNIFLYRFD